MRAPRVLLALRVCLRAERRSFCASRGSARRTASRPTRDVAAGGGEELLLDPEEYAAWHLGLTEGAAEEAKARYAFVYGDFRRLHRMGLLACHYRAAEWRHKEIELEHTSSCSTSTEMRVPRAGSVCRCALRF
jgi:hypothetical protein